MLIRSIQSKEIIRDHSAYAAVRTNRRARIIPVRKARRVALGDLVGLEFENAQTLTFQTQEMVFVERLASDEEIDHEISAYSRMLPSSDSLVATFFIYIREPEAIKMQLQDLQGLHTSITINVGDHAVPGVAIPPSDEEDDSQTVSVHVLRFTFAYDALEAFKDRSQPASIVVDHPRYSDDVKINEDLRDLLITDLG